MNNYSPEISIFRVPLKNILEYCNPLECNPWPHLDQDVTEDDVEYQLCSNNLLEKVYDPYKRWSVEQHAARIAFFCEKWNR